MAVQGADGVLKVPGLRKVMFLRYAETVDVLTQVIPTERSTQAFETWAGLVAPGAVELKTKGHSMVYKDMFVQNPKRIEAETFALGIQMIWEDTQDELYGQYKKVFQALGRAHRLKQAEGRANIFNGAFSTTLAAGYDNLALCSTAHTLLGVDKAWAYSTSPAVPNPRTATTWSNRLPTDADFDYLSYIDALTLLRRTPSPEGSPTALTPKWLLGATELQPSFAEITGSPQRPDTGNRAISAVNNIGVTPITSTLIFDTDAWWVVGDEHDLHFFMRQELESRTRDMPGTWDMTEETAHRSSWGFDDPRGVVGTPGA